LQHGLFWQRSSDLWSWQPHPNLDLIFWHDNDDHDDLGHDLDHDHDNCCYHYTDWVSISAALGDFSTT
jgi:hypothetical protein